MDTPVLPHVPALIAAYMRAAVSSWPGGRAGPFTIGFDAHSDDPMRNYAVHDQGACPGAGDIGILITFFRHSHRIPRLEYIEEDAPRAWPALAAAGFTMPYPPGPHDIARLTSLTRRGGLVAIAVDDSSGTVTGTGLVDVAGDCPAVGELAAVGVLTAFRRRGIASALSAHLARTAHSGGISLVFLEAEPEEEQIYRRTGFTNVTTKLWASIR
jgi:GNAT superfamily N-acetyltransferase